MYDSPFVRRVAVTLNLLEVPYEQSNWSVGRDFDRIRELNPLGRVPTLVLDGGEVLVDSATILDYLDEFVGPQRALVPRAGAERRRILKLAALATGAAEKGALQVYETAFRPAERRHAPWVERCAAQMHGTLGALERHAREATGAWLVGERLTQADVSVTCAFTYLCEAVGAERGTHVYPALAALATRCEAMPAFRAAYAAFFVPQPPS